MHSLKREFEKASNEKAEIQRHYIMVRPHLLTTPTDLSTSLSLTRVNTLRLVYNMTLEHCSVSYTYNIYRTSTNQPLLIKFFRFLEGFYAVFPIYSHLISYTGIHCSYSIRKWQTLQIEDWHIKCPLFLNNWFVFRGSLINGTSAVNGWCCFESFVCSMVCNTFTACRTLAKEGQGSLLRRVKGRC